MQPDQRRRQVAYRLRRLGGGGVDNEPVIALEHEAMALDAQRRAVIAETARRRERMKSIKRGLGIAVALSVLGLAIALGALV